MFNTSWIIRSALLAGMGLGVVGCESHTGTDALVGGAAGAGIGALVGSVSHARAGEGALIGGAIGAIGGGIVGNEQDRRGWGGHWGLNEGWFFKGRAGGVGGGGCGGRGGFRGRRGG